MVQVGGARDGSRIGKVLYDRVPEPQMVPVLTGLLRAIRDRLGMRPGRVEMLRRGGIEIGLEPDTDVEGEELGPWDPEDPCLRAEGSSETDQPPSI